MLAFAAQAAADLPSFGTTIGLGLGTVFVGLLCLIVIISLMSLIFRLINGNKRQAPAAPAPAAQTMSAADRQQMIAAVSSAIATAMGKDVAGIRITSFKKVN